VSNDLHLAAIFFWSAAVLFLISAVYSAVFPQDVRVWRATLAAGLVTVAGTLGMVFWTVGSAVSELQKNLSEIGSSFPGS
jgi:hypothetical protein